MTGTRRAAVAGTFYPADRPALRRLVEDLLADAPRDGPRPAALIAPHAGYAYSGPVAAAAYRTLLGRGDAIDRVVLVGPCHHVPFRGVAAPSARAFESPLGRVPVDASVRTAPGVAIREDAHRAEHSLEVHLPFLQVVLGDFRLLPLVVGDATPDEVAAALDALWTGRHTLAVVSTDLSHGLGAEAAARMDRVTARAIEDRRPEALGPGSACGRLAVAGLLLVARRRGLAVRLLDLRSSADTAGGRERVVGYGAFAVEPPV